MPDILDAVQDNLDREYERAAKRRFFEMPVGKAGACEECGEQRPRLINNLCGKCRDELRKN